ncbi:MAG: ThuA domain-containing protein [Halioglobus sp.]|nr:ThuA domain-containing protein [Halioglobus sp.]
MLLLLLFLAGCRAGEVTVERHAHTKGPGAAARVLFIAGPDSHGPLAHEHEAGTRLLSSALRQRRPDLETIEVYGGWPEDETVFEGIDAVVMYCDGGRGHLINDHLQTFGRLLDAGVGVTALHYCVEVPKGGDEAANLLRAIGGYFETHWSVNPHWEADFASLPPHPIAAGISPFKMLDEWYFNMRFLDKGVTPVLSAVAPAHTMERRNGPHSGNEAVRKLVAAGVPQVVAWAFERPGGGRGFGYTGGHFHHNWQDDNARELVLNAIEWTTAK